MLALVLVACGSDGGDDKGATGGTSGSGATGGTSTGGSSNGGTSGDGGTSGNGGTGGNTGGGGGFNLIPMFVAQGHMGRTTISCDLGQTWIEDKNDDPNVICFDGTDCDHNPGAANGITWVEGGGFFATFGWGDPPGGVRKSLDGITWDPVLTGTTFGDIAAGLGKVIGAARQPKATANLGADWTDLEYLDIGDIYNIREGAFASVNGGRFVFAGNDGDNRVIAVSNDGVTFSTPTFPADCDVSFYRTGGIAAGNGAIVITSSGVTGCRSADGGDTWETVNIGSGFDSLLLFDGTQFVGWGGGKKWTSSDGASWTSTDTTPGNIVLGPVAVSDPGGTYVGVSGAWGADYENQVFYRSTDGIIWTESTSFTGGHPIVDMAFGFVPPSASCPLP